MTTTLLMAFLAGLLSFLSPCILPLAPGYLSILSGSSLNDLNSGFARKKVIVATAFFILGFSLVFILMGITSSFLGQLLRSNRFWLARVGGFIVILLGLHQAGWLPIAWLYHERKVTVKDVVGRWGAFLTGLAFSFGWTPCVGPILGSILTLAGSKAGVGQALGLLTVYSAGLALPFLLLALVFEKVAPVLLKLKSNLKYLKWFTGSLMMVMGVLLISGSFPRVIFWFMQLTGGWNPESLLK